MRQAAEHGHRIQHEAAVRFVVHHRALRRREFRRRKGTEPEALSRAFTTEFLQREENPLSVEQGYAVSY